MITKEQLQQQIEVNKDIPVKGVVLALKKKTRETTDSGIIKPDTVVAAESKLANESYVVAVNPSHANSVAALEKETFKPGDCIRIERFAEANELKSVVPGYELVYVREHMILSFIPSECATCETKCEVCK